MIPWKNLGIFAAGVGASSLAGYVGIGVAAIGFIAGSWVFKRRNHVVGSEPEDGELEFAFMRPEHKTDAGDTQTWDNKDLQSAVSFDMDLANVMIHVSCEAYRQPPAGVGYQTHDVHGLPSVTFFNKDILTKTFAGVVVVTVVEAKNLRKAYVASRVSPYAVVSVSEGSYRTKTLKYTNKFVWNETTCLYISDPEADALCVRIYDDDRFAADEDLGVAVMGLGKLRGRKNEEKLLVLPLRGTSGEYSSIIIKCKVRLFSDHDPDSIEELKPVVEAAAEASKAPNGKAVPIALTARATSEEPAKAPATIAKGGKAPISPAEPNANPGPEAAFPPVAFIDDGESDTQVWLRWKPEERKLVVAFRGTEKFKDMVTDIRMAHAAFVTPIGKVVSGVNIHRGVMGAYRYTRRILATMVYVITTSNADGKPWDVILTGHSLGGALATLGAFDVTMFKKYSGNIRSIRMYTYGQPRVGNKTFAEQFDLLVPDAWRMTNKNDVVPGLPPSMAMINYCHVGHAVRLDEKGVVAILPNLTEKAEAKQKEKQDDKGEEQKVKPKERENQKPGFSLLWLPIKIVTLPTLIIPGFIKPKDRAYALSATNEINPVKALLSGKGISEHLGKHYKTTISAALAQGPPATAFGASA